jgi:acetylornithine/succinyldiaminopimelate/putrescine aminotransferase
LPWLVAKVIIALAKGLSEHVAISQRFSERALDVAVEPASRGGTYGGGVPR